MVNKGEQNLEQIPNHFVTRLSLQVGNSTDVHNFQVIRQNQYAGTEDIFIQSGALVYNTNDSTELIGVFPDEDIEFHFVSNSTSNNTRSFLGIDIKNSVGLIALLDYSQANIAFQEASFQISVPVNIIPSSLTIVEVDNPDLILCNFNPQNNLEYVSPAETVIHHIAIRIID